jgi:hypothetical protein
MAPTKAKLKVIAMGLNILPSIPERKEWDKYN